MESWSCDHPRPKILWKLSFPTIRKKKENRFFSGRLHAERTKTSGNCYIDTTDAWIGYPEKSEKRWKCSWKIKEADIIIVSIYNISTDMHLISHVYIYIYYSEVCCISNFCIIHNMCLHICIHNIYIYNTCLWYTCFETNRYRFDVSTMSMFSCRGESQIPVKQSHFQLVNVHFTIDS